MRPGIKSILLLYVIFISSIIQMLDADNRILLLLRHAPDEVIQDVIDEMAKKKDLLFEKLLAMHKNTPGQNSIKLAKNALRAQLVQSLGGLAAIYAGYVTTSTPDGMITLPLRHANPKVYLAITPEVKPIFVKGSTISHFEFSANVPVKYYSFERKKDEKLKLTYWETKEEKSPADRKMNPITITLLSKPDNLYVPLGKSLSVDSSHLVLPSLYVIGFNSANQAILQLLDQKRYLESISFEEKKASDTSMQRMMSNL